MTRILDRIKKVMSPHVCIHFSESKTWKVKKAKTPWTWFWPIFRKDLVKKKLYFLCLTQYAKAGYTNMGWDHFLRLESRIPVLCEIIRYFFFFFSGESSNRRRSQNYWGLDYLWIRECQRVAMTTWLLFQSSFWAERKSLWIVSSDSSHAQYQSASVPELDNCLAAVPLEYTAGKLSSRCQEVCPRNISPYDVMEIDYLHTIILS